MTFVTCYDCITHKTCRANGYCAQGMGAPSNQTSIAPPIVQKKLESQRFPEFSAPPPPRTKLRPIDTSELGPIHIPTPSYRQTQARIVREAFEAAAIAEPDRNAAQHLIEAARRCDTETLAYIARSLKT